jgi:hypothetical protein
MPIPKGTVLRPFGNPNPNIAEISKKKSTGPKTDLGKLKIIILNAGVKRKTKLLARFMRCKQCPLGQRKVTVTVDNKEKEIIRPPMCQYWSLERGKCVIELQDYINQVRDFFTYYEKMDNINTMKMLSLKSLQRSEWTENMELLKTGQTQKQSLDEMKLAGEFLEKAHKMEYGDKMQVADVTEIIKAKYDRWFSVDTKKILPEKDNLKETESVDESLN